jgi:2-keto-4-pentenoate hydratase
MIDVAALARELLDARGRGGIVEIPPSARVPGFDLDAAYAVEAELVRLRKARGRSTVGYKVGAANRTLWPSLGLETVTWAHMYDDTVRYAPSGRMIFELEGFVAPKIETEIVFRVASPFDADADASTALQHVEWIALGFEIVDCPYPGGTFQPWDAVAAFGFHVAAMVGKPRPVTPASIPELVEQLANLVVQLLKDEEPVADGSGRNVLGNPALALAELNTAMLRRTGQGLAQGNLVSSGALTDAQVITTNERWTAHVDGIGLPDLTVTTRYGTNTR